MWKDLSMQQRADLMDIYLSHGITSLDEMRRHYDSRDIGTANAYREGGNIFIKPENRGKFTALKERTGHSATWFKEHGTPAQKRMATFALNARKWKHGLGGNLYEFGGDGGNNPRIVTTGGAGYVPSTNINPEEVKNKIRKNLYDNVDTHSYQSLSDAILGGLGVKSTATNRIIESQDELTDANGNYIDFNAYESPMDDAIWATYLGIPKNQRRKRSGELKISKYTPSIGKENGTIYYEFPITDPKYVIHKSDNLPINGNKVVDMDYYGAINVGDFTVGRGYDSRGEYRSVYDKWDINPFRGVYRKKGLIGNIGNRLLGKKGDLSFGIGKPVNLYNRIYLDDYYKVPAPYRGGVYLPEVTVYGKKKKKAYGGNLFDGTSQPTQQMNNGYYRQNGNPVAFDSEGNLVDQVSGDRGTMMLPEYTVTGHTPTMWDRMVSRAGEVWNTVRGPIEQAAMTAGNLPFTIYGGLSKLAADAFASKDTYANAHTPFGEGLGHERDNIINVANSIAGERNRLEMMGFRNVDGKYKYPKPDGMSDDEYLKWCAENANIISGYYGHPTAGDAWTRHGIYGDSAIVQAPYTKDEYYIPRASNKARSMSKDQARYVASHIDDPGIELKSGDIVDMRYPKSSFTSEAWYSGDKKLPNTHTGTIIKTGPRKEDTYVAHYFKGGLQLEPIGDLIGVSWTKPYVTGIRRAGTKEHPYK